MALNRSFWVWLGSLAAVASACGSSDAVKHVPTKYDGGGEGGESPGSAGSAEQPGQAGDNEAGAGPVTSGGGAPASPPTGSGGEVERGPGAAGAGGVAGEQACFGSPCSCVRQIHGSAVVRDDGRLLLIGNGTQRPVRSAVSTQPLDQVVSAWPGQYLGCAVRSDGSVWCWANQENGNAQGLLGTGSGMPTVNPYDAYQVQVAPGKLAPPVYLSDVQAFHSGATGGGGGTLCAVTHAGAIYCWGPMSLNGDLAQTGKDEPYAQQVRLDSDTFVTGAVELAVGYRHACYTNAQGEVYCWGKNIGGPLGDGSENDSRYPVRAGTLSGVSKLVAGPDYTCAIGGSAADTGRVYCWGSASFGLLGIGTPTENGDVCGSSYCKRTPTRVRSGPSAFLDDVVELAAGQQTVCALRADRSAWCWGGVNGNYAVRLEAPPGTPLPEVGLLGVHGDEWRVLLTDGTFYDIAINRQPTPVTVNCGALD
jgi:hypothetical protein